MAISADLGSKLENYVSKLVASGRYNSKSEVIREGIRLVQEREQRFKALDAGIARGLGDAKAGRTVEAGAAFDKLEAKFSARAEASTK